ncbi:hypothetical protein B0T22DRAFT_497814 [Podospora appendiculata]|uniref:Nuclear GTPase SLIP-GC n=1 Tax=Podospora appendiculata TaxID=314037 RepID=A0AAE0X741_9PEZI|nr:hypothetical protein B0T22DRAFT_497814 [Podospora appendiculata]
MAPVKPEPMDGLGYPPIPYQNPRTRPEPRPTPDPASDVEPKSESTSHLQELVSAMSPEALEEGVRAGLRVLKSLKGPLDAAAPLSNTQASDWLECIQRLEGRSKPSRTIVGVVGNTGAGKSSVISAVLDEERLLPTNCMRACTASPTEISFNHSEDPRELYRAEVEFLAHEDWLKELQGLFTDLIDGTGQVSRECSNEDSEAGIAFAKIKAVYPKKTKEMIAESTPEKLANEFAVRRVLGTVKKLQATDAASIYRQLQTYVDSKEKNNERMMEFWPLIKVVRIFTKASALATGACLVDLPGVQDSNAARAAVAANYMKACTGLWIVAPITRAVDDKTAKSLLGDSFRRQLKYDGTYSAVTFICSKTDDISVTEAAESLDIEDQVGESWTKIRGFENDIQKLKSRQADLRDEKEACDELAEGIDQAFDEWEDLMNKLSEGEIVYAPSDTPSKKRKRTSKPSGCRKNRVSIDSDDSDFLDSGDDASNKENSQPADENRQPLTEDEIERKLATLKAEKKELRDNKKEVTRQIIEARIEIKQIIAKKDTLLAEVKAICIKGRNEYSRRAIKHDFAMGIKELDQENAAEEDEATFDPEVDIRDYDEVAKTLPVFCVSSRAFQKLNGRLQRDDFKHDGFRTVDDTEIPQLQAHARKLTEAGRAADSRAFLNDLMQLLNSMKMWAANDGTRSNLSDGEKRAEDIRLRRRLHKFEEELDKAVIHCVGSIKDALTDNVYDQFDTYIPTAVEAALPTTMGWGAHRDMGGLLWATYKATCRRNGVYSGASGPRDFNAELFEPISKHLAGNWERAFQRRLPAALDGLSRSVNSLLNSFHREATAKALERGTNFNSLNILGQQLQAHIQRVTGVPAMIRAMIQELQRDANRMFTPVIEEKMIPAYDECTNERGPGSFKRMKDDMARHVETNRATMFREATGAVQGQLEQMCTQIEEAMSTELQDLYARVARDYLAVLVGSDASAMQGLSRAERMLRQEMAPMLDRADLYFSEDVKMEEFESNEDAGVDEGIVAGKSREPSSDEHLFVKSDERAAQNVAIKPESREREEAKEATSEAEAAVKQEAHTGDDDAVAASPSIYDSMDESVGDENVDDDGVDDENVDDDGAKDSYEGASMDEDDEEYNLKVKAVPEH